MASSSLLSEDQFLCSICLDVFNRPVSTPCGHNFCMACISNYWDDSVICQCPLCKEQFDRRPDLKVNTFISELASQFRSLQMKDVQVRKPVQPQPSHGSEVLCDICTGTKEPAVRSCLECLTSYCDVHLEPHHRATGLKRHTLVDPVPSLEERVCKDHARLLTAFCRWHQVLLCDICHRLTHTDCDVITVQEAYDQNKAKLADQETFIQKKIIDHLQEARAMKDSADKSLPETRNLVAECVQELTELISEIQHCQTEMERAINERQKATQEQANRFLIDKEEEMAQLQITAAKISELKENEDCLGFLLNVPKISFQWPTMTPLTFAFDRHVDAYHIRKCLSKTVPQMKELLKNLNEGIKHLFDCPDLTDHHLQIFMRFYVHEMSLDVETAHPQLIVSEDKKQVRYNTDSGLRRALKQNSKAFTVDLAVLGSPGVSSYKFYFEVFVGEKTEWCLGMAKGSIQRKAEIPRKPGCGLWAIWFIKDRFETFCNPNVIVHHGKVERVGVLVLYESNSIEFYDVKTLTKIHSFHYCSFTEEIFPYLNPCDNEYGSNLDPMIMVPLIRSKPDALS